MDRVLMIHVGCATWRLPKPLQEQFPGEGTHLARYSRRLPAVEINSSFYGHHRRSQYAKWAAQVPSAFRFAVKMPRTLTHSLRLRGTDGLDQLIEEIDGLGEKLGPLLMQLPPSLGFEPDHVEVFLATLRLRFDGGVICEPRHESWFDGRADTLLEQYQVSRAAVDPPPHQGAGRPGGWPGRVYVRLHGSPRRFYSSYPDRFLAELAEDLRIHQAEAETWCIFNNTANESGLGNALTLLRTLNAE